MTIIALISSQNVENIPPFEVFLDLKIPPKKSKILLNQIRAIDKQRLLKKVDLLNPEFIEEVNRALKISLGLN